MKYSMVADIMFVAPGEHGPVWPDTKGIVSAMELAKANGLDAIEMFDFEGRDLDTLAGKIRELGIGIHAFCMKNGKVWGDPSKLDEFVRGFRESVDAAKKLGAENLIISDDGYARDAQREAVHAAMAEGLKRVAPLAEQAGLTILVEPVSGNYFRDSKEAFDILKEVNSPKLKLLYDIFHFQLIEGNILNALKENLEWIGHIHGAGAPMRCELTDGELNYRFLLNELDKLGYDGCFGLEFFTFTDREEKVRKSAELLRNR
ncbi:MAG: TIM barrel protein [Oscillospiraceae bacterium]|nr:TIM barrel protein [Oscillospiraceae bacterium]